MDGFTAYILGWNLPEIICFVVGMILIFIEMFTPGIGVPGISGAILLLAAVVLRADTVANALITLAIALVILVVCGYFMLRSFKRGALSKSPIILKESISSESTSISDEEMQKLVGTQGVALTTLRPSGNADFSGRKLDVVSSGEFICKGANIVVESVQGLRILVKEIKEQ